MKSRGEIERPFRIEACVESWQEALLAEKRGAHQVELCAALDVDGLTPSEDVIKACIDNLRIPVKVLIRSRKGNFEYSEKEIEQALKVY